MKILVFGKGGQLSTELLRLKSDELDIQALDRNEADLAEPEVCASIIRACDADAIINAAAFTAVDRAEDEEALATLINGETPAILAKASDERGVPFLHVSTDYVFDGSGDVPWKEADWTGPLNAYGRSKLKGEEGVLAAGKNTAVLRTSWIVSAHGNNFVKTMLRLAESRDHLNIVSDQIGGPTVASDIAVALLTMARAMCRGQSGGLYHFSGVPEVSWADFAREIFAQSGKNVMVEDIPSANYLTPARRPLNSRLDCRKIELDFGILQPDWRDGLGRILKALS